MDEMTMLEGLAMCAVAVCMITFAIMATSNIFHKDESCRPKEDDHDTK